MKNNTLKIHEVVYIFYIMNLEIYIYIIKDKFKTELYEKIYIKIIILKVVI